MVKRASNVFGSSSESESEGEDARIKNIKRKKPLPKFAVSKGADDEITTNDNEVIDYMEYPLDKHDDNSNDEYEDQLKYQGLKYDQVQQLKRDEALKKSLFVGDQEKSIGLSIMEKMGFKVGDALGNSEDRSESDSKPIDVKIKTNRLGVGASNLGEQPLIVVNDPIDVLEYRDRIQKTKTDSRASSMINQAMKLCFQLSGDMDRYYEERGIRIETVNKLWKPYVTDLIEADVAKAANAKIIRIDNGTDKPEVESTPPFTDAKELKIDEDYEKYLALAPEAKLAELLVYLRGTYRYCLFCGCSFANKRDLEANCPGIYEENHNDQ